MTDNTPAMIVDLIAESLRRSRPPGIAPSLDCAFQHKRDCDYIADALAAHVADFDLARFMAHVGWPNDAVVRIGNDRGPRTGKT